MRPVTMLLALILAIAPALAQAPRSPAMTGVEANLDLLTLTDRQIAIGEPIAFRFDTNNVPTGSSYGLFASLSRGQSSVSTNNLILPFDLSAPVEVLSGIVTTPNWVVPATVPNVPALVGATVYFQYYVSDGVRIHLSNLAQGGPIIVDVILG